VVVEEEVVSPPAAAPVSVPAPAVAPPFVPVPAVERSVVVVVLLEVLELPPESGTTTVVEGGGTEGC
jgi:hypothetical protein